MLEEKVEKKEDNFEAKLEAVLSEIKGLGNSVNEVKEEAKSTKEEIKTMKKEESNDYNEYTSEEDKLRNEIKNLSQKIESLETKTAKNQESSDYERDCAQWDYKAGQEFPWLGKKTKLDDEVNKIMAEIKPIGIKNGKPQLPSDSVYQAALKAAARNPELILDLKRRTFEPLENGFERKVKGEDINEVQKEIMGLLGVKQSERLKERYKTFNDKKSARH